MMTVKLTLLFLVFTALPNSDFACTFPSDLVGTWESSGMGTISFTTSQVTIPNVYTYGNLVFDCNSTDGSKYMIRSTTDVMLFSTAFKVVSCFDAITMKTSSIKYTLQHATAKQSSANDWRIQLVPDADALVYATICNEPTPYSSGTYDVLVKTGAIASAKIQCPDALLGTFTYTFDKGSGTQCSSASYATGCSDLTKLDFDLAVCSSVVAYSSVGELYCVYSSSDAATSLNYVHLYNTDVTVDGSTTYRYACLVYTTTGVNVSITQYPSNCLTDQNDTVIASPGAVLFLTSNLTCVPTTPPTTTTGPTAAASVAAMAAGITFAVIILIILVVVFCVFFVGRDRMKRASSKSSCKGGCRKCFTRFLRNLTLCGGRFGVCLRRTKVGCLQFWKECCECQGSKVEPESDETVIISSDKSGKDTVQVPADQRDIISPSNLVIQEGSVTSETSDDAKGSNLPRRLPPIESPRKKDEVDDEDDPSSHASKLPPISEHETDGAVAGDDQTAVVHLEADAPVNVDNSPYGKQGTSDDPVTPRIGE